MVIVIATVKNGHGHYTVQSYDGQYHKNIIDRYLYGSWALAIGSITLGPMGPWPLAFVQWPWVLGH